MQSVKSFVDNLSLDRVDILINNAGLYGCPDSESADGIEQTFATNYLGPFYLTMLLLKKFDKVERVINVSSGLYPRGEIDVENLEKLLEVPSTKDGSRKLYSTSKLAQIYHAQELALQFPRVLSCSMHPGLVYTNLARYTKPNNIFARVLSPLLPYIIRTPEEGAQTVVFCCVDEKIQNGGYYGDCELETLKPVATDCNIQSKLWYFSLDTIKSKVSF